jgi:hypothetical protein
MYRVNQKMAVYIPEFVWTKLLAKSQFEEGLHIPNPKLSMSVIFRMTSLAAKEKL